MGRRSHQRPLPVALGRFQRKQKTKKKVSFRHSKPSTTPLAARHPSRSKSRTNQKTRLTRRRWRRSDDDCVGAGAVGGAAVPALSLERIQVRRRRRRDAIAQPAPTFGDGGPKNGRRRRVFFSQRQGLRTFVCGAKRWAVPPQMILEMPRKDLGPDSIPGIR